MSELTSGYPVLLHLQDKPVAVIGGGRVATRKVDRLLRAGARVLVISPALSTELSALAEQGQIEWIDSVYQRDMFNEFMPVIVIAATDNDRTNQKVAQDAHRIRALCNVANGSSDHSDFSNMAQIDRPPLTIALSTNGHSPALLRLLKSRLSDEIGEEYAVLADWLGGDTQRAAHAVSGPSRTPKNSTKKSCIPKCCRSCRKATRRTRSGSLIKSCWRSRANERRRPDPCRARPPMSAPNTAGIVWRYVDRLRRSSVADEVTACFWKEAPEFFRCADDGGVGGCRRRSAVHGRGLFQR